MSNRSINGFTTNIRSLNGLEGVAIESVLGGDAISITDTSKSKKTINVNISKQDAVTSVADDDLFLLENASGTIKKITGLHLKDSSDGFFFKNNNDIFCDLASDNLVIGSVDTSINSSAFKLHVVGTSKFTGAITNDALSTFNASLAVKNTSNPTESGFIQFFDEDNTHSIKLFAGGTTQSVTVDRIQFLPDATGTVALLESLSASAPIVYNNSTGAFTFDNTSTGFITLSSLSASSPLSYNNSSGVFSTTFTASSTDTLTNKTFDSEVVPFNKGLSTKFDSNTTTSGFVRFFEKTGSGSNFADLHLQDHRVIDPVGTGSGNINVFLPTTVNDTILVGRDTADTLTNKTITSFTGNSSATITTPSTTTILVGRDTTDTLTNKTIASFEGNSGATITTPSTTGTIVVEETAIWKTQGTNIITSQNTSLSAIDLPNNCSIRNDSQDTQFIKFSHTTSTNETIELASNQVSVENILMYGGNSSYYLQFGNGTLNSTFNEIHIPTNSYIERDTSSDFIQFKTGILHVNQDQIDLKSGASSAKIRNATTTTNYIQLDTTFGLFVNLNCKVAGDIFNCADNRFQIEEVGSNARVHIYDPTGTDNGASIAGAYMSYHQNGTELHLNCPNDTFDNTLSQNITFRMAGDAKVRVNGLARESLTFFGNTNVTLNGTNYHQYGSVGMTEGGVFGSNLGSSGLSGLATPSDEEFMGFFGGNLNNTEGFCVMSNADLMFISNAGNGGVALQYIDEDNYPSTSPKSWKITDTGTIVPSSDERIKTSVNTYKNSDFEKYKKIRTITYKLKESEFVSEKRKKDPKYKLKYNNIHYGVIAQELYEIYPELETSVKINERKEWKIKKEKWDELYPEELRKWNKRKKDFDKSNGKEKKDFRVRKPTEKFDIEEPMRSVDYNRISLLTVGVVQELIKTVEKQQEQINSLKTTIDKLNQSKSFKEFKSN